MVKSASLILVLLWGWGTSNLSLLTLLNRTNSGITKELKVA